MTFLQERWWTGNSAAEYRVTAGYCPSAFLLWQPSPCVLSVVSWYILRWLHNLLPSRIDWFRWRLSASCTSSSPAWEKVWAHFCNPILLKLKTLKRYGYQLLPLPLAREFQYLWKNWSFFSLREGCLHGRKHCLATNPTEWLQAQVDFQFCWTLLFLTIIRLLTLEKLFFSSSE